MSVINKIILKTATALTRTSEVVAKQNKELSPLMKVGSLEAKAGDSFVSSALGDLTRNEILAKYCLKNNYHNQQNLDFLFLKFLLLYHY